MHSITYACVVSVKTDNKKKKVGKLRTCVWLIHNCFCRILMLLKSAIHFGTNLEHLSSSKKANKINHRIIKANQLRSHVEKDLRANRSTITSMKRKEGLEGLILKIPLDILRVVLFSPFTTNHICIYMLAADLF